MRQYITIWKLAPKIFGKVYMKHTQIVQEKLKKVTFDNYIFVLMYQLIYIIEFNII